MVLPTLLYRPEDCSRWQRKPVRRAGMHRLPSLAVPLNLRVADVSGMPALIGRDVCASSYQGRLACVDASNGSVRWAREISADVGPGLDQRYVFASDERGNLQAFSRDSGSSLWRNTSLSWRGLSSPVSFGRAVVVGDRQGYLHFFSREEGALLARVQTDGSAIRATPVVAGSTLIVQSQNGSLLAISTE